jgi:hypothetical protein
MLAYKKRKITYQRKEYWLDLPVFDYTNDEDRDGKWLQYLSEKRFIMAKELGVDQKEVDPYKMIAFSDVDIKVEERWYPEASIQSMSRSLIFDFDNFISSIHRNNYGMLKQDGTFEFRTHLRYLSQKTLYKWCVDNNKEEEFNPDPWDFRGHVL